MSHKKQIIRESIKKQHVTNSGKHAILSEKICHFLTASFPFETPICCYYPKLYEVNLLPFYEQLLRAGATIYLPKYNINEKSYMFGLIKDLSYVRRGFFNIYEPITDHTITIKQASKLIKTWLVPGLAFDLNGYRLGHGHGYYDSFLYDSNATLIGICYRYQIIDSIPTEKHDVKCQYIINENEMVKLEQK